MHGSPIFSLVQTPIERSLKKLEKSYKSVREKQTFQRLIIDLLTDLCCDPQPLRSALEPLPGKISLPPRWEFRKLSFAMLGLRGASGQGRLMYLVNSAEYKLILVWIYTHREFEGRPDDKSLRLVLKDAIHTVSEAAELAANEEENIDSINDSFSDPL